MPFESLQFLDIPGLATLIIINNKRLLIVFCLNHEVPLYIAEVKIKIEILEFSDRGSTIHIDFPMSSTRRFSNNAGSSPTIILHENSNIMSTPQTSSAKDYPISLNSKQQNTTTSPSNSRPQSTKMQSSKNHIRDDIFYKTLMTLQAFTMAQVEFEKSCANRLGKFY
jgi:hypothetical protein